MRSPIPHLAFKIKYDNIINELTTDVHIFDFEKKNNHLFKAIWDTGATHSVITKAVVDKLNLKPTGVAEIHAVNNKKDCHTYVINLRLPNRLMIPKLNVAMVDVHGSDLLIGMDVISTGDFSISNHGITTFCYSSPPHYNEIDLVARANEINKKNKLTK